MLYSCDAYEMFEAPVVLSVRLSAVMGERENYVGIELHCSGDERRSDGVPYQHMARLQVDVAKQLYRELGDMIDSVTGVNPAD